MFGLPARLYCADRQKLRQDLGAPRAAQHASLAVPCMLAGGHLRRRDHCNRRSCPEAAHPGAAAVLEQRNIRVCCLRRLLSTLQVSSCCGHIPVSSALLR